MTKKEHEKRSYLPLCWDDERRMQSLFSTFRNKEVNPTGWQGKMDFWVDLLNSYTNSQKVAVMSANDICVAFERNNKYPACIDEVLNYMYRQKIITTEKEYTYSEPSKSWLSWSYRVFVKHPFDYAFSFIRDILFLSPEVERFIFLDALKSMADSIFRKFEENQILSNRPEHVMFLEDFRKQCTDICEGDNFTFALMQLEREGRVLKFSESQGIEAIKFKEKEKDFIELTEVDRAVLRLRKSINQNEQEINDLEAEAEKCKNQIRRQLKEGLKDRALLTLKKRKRIQKDIQKKTSSLDNLELLLMQVQNCQSEKLILDAYKTGSNALKRYLHMNLDLDKVDETMDNVKETLDDAEEIQRTLSGSVDIANDDSELEDELKALVNIKVSYIDKDSMPNLPEVPTHSIATEEKGANKPLKSPQEIKKRKLDSVLAL